MTPRDAAKDRVECLLNDTRGFHVDDLDADTRDELLSAIVRAVLGGTCAGGEGHVWEIKIAGDGIGDIVQCARCYDILGARTLLRAYLKEHSADSVRGGLP